MGSLDHPFNPVSVALGAEATFVARALDSDRKQLTSVLRAAAEHEGTALVEIYQNCNIFNDGEYDVLKDADSRDDRTISLHHGEPLVFGRDGRYAVVRGHATGRLTIVETATVDPRDIVVHDAHDEDPSYAYALSRLSTQDLRHTPMGVFRSVRRPTYDAQMRTQLETAAAAEQADLASLLHGNDTWSVD
jgi:2-oxoglutarate ferredoxin oxidoreductase subunit beta